MNSPDKERMMELLKRKMERQNYERASEILKVRKKNRITGAVLTASVLAICKLIVFQFNFKLYLIKFIIFTLLQTFIQCTL